MFSNRSPTTETNSAWSNPKSSLSLPPRAGSPASPVTPDTATMEAHRNREQKWMSLLGSSPASQSRKSKKVRKLVLEGVPASVRYLVWTHLTDGKGKAVPGVYPQLCKRGAVPLSDRIEADVETSAWFLDQERSQLQTLREAGGGIVQLLEAYLNMVPDIQYSPGESGYCFREYWLSIIKVSLISSVNSSLLRRRKMPSGFSYPSWIRTSVLTSLQEVFKWMSMPLYSKQRLR